MHDAPQSGITVQPCQQLLLRTSYSCSQLGAATCALQGGVTGAEIQLSTVIVGGDAVLFHTDEGTGGVISNVFVTHFSATRASEAAAGGVPRVKVLCKSLLRKCGGDQEGKRGRPASQGSALLACSVDWVPLVCAPTTFDKRLGRRGLPALIPPPCLLRLPARGCRTCKAPPPSVAAHPITGWRTAWWQATSC